ncbi:MAG: hypothetical protein LBQ56_00515, partial [Synergistaceae bacterium]|nr:hypothetical protein [Synergistaceae bacterium]
MFPLFSSRNFRRSICAAANIITIAAALGALLAGGGEGSQMERAFWARDWAGAERIYQAASNDVVKWVS